MYQSAKKQRRTWVQSPFHACALTTAASCATDTGPSLGGIGAADGSFHK